MPDLSAGCSTTANTIIPRPFPSNTSLWSPLFALQRGFPKIQQATQSSVSDYHSSPTSPESTPESHIARFFDRAITEEKDNKAKTKLKEEWTLTANDWEQLNDGYTPIELIRIISMALLNLKIQMQNRCIHGSLHKFSSPASVN